MPLQTLVDLFDVKIGNVQLGRGTMFGPSVESNFIESAGDAAFGTQFRDRTHDDLKVTLECEDPLALPLVLALQWPQQIEASGRIAGTATYQKEGIKHGVLIGFSVAVNDKGKSVCRFDFQNCAAEMTAALEELIGTATAPTLVDRATLFGIEGATFTPDSGSAISFDGIKQVSMNAQGIVDAMASPGSQVINYVDVMGFRFSGSLNVLNHEIVGTTNLRTALTAAGVGTLDVECWVSGRWNEESPVNKVITFERVSFGGGSGNMREKGRADGTIQFGQTPVTQDNNLMAINGMVTIDDAA